MSIKGKEVYKDTTTWEDRWALCQVCGFKHKTSDLTKIVDKEHPYFGLIVCRDDNVKKPPSLMLGHVDFSEPGPRRPDMISPQHADTYETITATGAVPFPPRYPKILDISSGYIYLIWNHPENNVPCPTTGYLIERALYPAGSWSTLVTTTTPAMEYKDSTVTAGVSYRYRISAINAVGTSSATSEIWGTAV